MIILTKKYILIWDTNTKEIINNYKTENTGKCYVGNGRGYFESDVLSEVEDKIQELGLVEKEV